MKFGISFEFSVPRAFYPVSASLAQTGTEPV